MVDAEGRWNASAQNGHYVGRANHELRFNDENCNLQCAHCNAWLDKLTMLKGYRDGIELKYGDGTAERLEGAEKRYGSKKDELLEIIADSKAQIKFYEKER